MSKMQNLQQALRQSSGKAASAEPEKQSDAPPKAQMPATRQPSRAGQVNISAWLDRNYKSSLRLVQARKGGDAALQDLLAEALNDLFSKYDVPTVRQD
jgi:hypothetical protein